MFEAFQKLRLASAFLGRPAVSHGEVTVSTAEIFGDLDALSLERFGGDLDAVFAGPGVTQLYENHYLPPPESVETLLELPEETLGFELGLYLRRHRLALTAPESIDFADRLAYVRERVRTSHPLVHVLTEYDASPLGELAVQAFFVGQFGNLISGTMLAAGLLQVIQREPDQLGDVLHMISEAFERGRSTRSLLGMPWEELFPAPAPQIRELFGLPPKTSTLAHLDLDRLRVEVDELAAEPELELEPAQALELESETSEFGAFAARAEPEPEPEPEPKPSGLASYRGERAGSKTKTRWAGLDLLSEAASLPEPEPTDPEPTYPEEAEPLEPPEAATTTRRLDDSAESPLARALRGEEPSAGLGGFAGFATATATERPREPLPQPRATVPDPPRLDLRGPPRREPPRIADMPSAKGPPPAIEPPAPPQRAKPGEPGFTEEEPTDEQLPKPGDRDYF